MIMEEVKLYLFEYQNVFAKNMAKNVNICRIM